MAEVTLDNVSKVFPSSVHAVEDLTLNVADGELLVLVGPSGCGKTTTLRLVAGLDEPTQGRICIGGQVVNGVPPHRRDVAMVFQRPALYPHLNVRENLAFTRRLRRASGWCAADLSDIAGLLGLEGLLERMPSQLSGGQQQRVALGRALLRRPALYLLDEPLSSLDVKLRLEMRRELHLLQKRFRATMIYVTHDQAEALTLGDRVAVLHDGRLQQVDAPRALWDRPANRFVAGFLGWNLLSGRLDDGLQFRGADGCLAGPPGLSAAWKPHRGKRLVAGFRPEAVRAGLGNPNCRLPTGFCKLEMDILLAEPAGRGWQVMLKRGDWLLTALADDESGAELHEGRRTEAAVDMRQAHLFDGESGVALYHPP